MKFRKLYGIIGIILTAVSFGHWFLPYRNEFIISAHWIFYIGNILFFDYLSYTFGNFSLIHSNKKLVRLISHFLLVGVLFAFFAEVYIHWIGKFWYYPTLRYPWEYFLGIIPEFAIYTFYLLETYLGTKAVLEYLFVKRHHHKESFAGYKRLFMTLGVIGSVGLGACTIYILLQTTLGNTIGDTLSIIYKPFGSSISYFILVLIAIFFWLILEYLEFEKRETSMLYEFLRGNIWPTLAIFVAAWISAFIYEGFNAPSGAWRYANFPFQHVAIWGVPIIVFITWPFHYFPAFSLYRLLFKKETTQMWE